MDRNAGPRLLAIDDSANSADLVARVASRCGWDAQAAVDAKTARQLLSEWRPTVLTLDLCMPDSDGIDVMGMLQEQHFTGEVVIISGQEEWMRKSACRLAEARGLRIAGEMQKPIDVAALQGILERLRPVA
jgi:DNA-binding NtrC family response regulator